MSEKAEEQDWSPIFGSRALSRTPRPTEMDREGFDEDGETSHIVDVDNENNDGAATALADDGDGRHPLGEVASAGVDAEDAAASPAAIPDEEGYAYSSQSSSSSSSSPSTTGGGGGDGGSDGGSDERAPTGPPPVDEAQLTQLVDLGFPEVRQSTSLYY